MENKPYKILFKYPTRERQPEFINCIDALRNRIVDKNGSVLLINQDEDDSTMLFHDADTFISSIGFPAIVRRNENKSKVEAINRGLFDHDFDICVLLSDDMICQVAGFDNIIRQAMLTHFPDTDGCLWFHDGDRLTKNKLCTMVIAGRQYLERFGYIYHPSYFSLFCDNEYTIVAQRLNRIYTSGLVLFRHIHYMNTTGLKPDALMKRNQSYYSKDQTNFLKRSNTKFGL